MLEGVDEHRSPDLNLSVFQTPREFSVEGT